MIKNIFRHWRIHTDWDGYISWTIYNPFKTWWKARKYFKCPKITPFICLVKTFCGYPYASYHWIGKIIDIYFSDVIWKDKWDSPRHERNPLVWICLFRKIAFGLRFNIYKINEFGQKEDGNMYYWEYILDYLYYDKTLELKSCWTRYSQIFKKCVKYGEDEKDDEYKPYSIPIYTHLFSLNKRGLKEFKKLYDEKRNKKINQ